MHYPNLDERAGFEGLLALHLLDLGLGNGVKDVLKPVSEVPSWRNGRLRRAALNLEKAV